jgi:hypothetical protein
VQRGSEAPAGWALARSLWWFPLFVVVVFLGVVGAVAACVLCGVSREHTGLWPARKAGSGSWESADVCMSGLAGLFVRGQGGRQRAFVGTSPARCVPRGRACVGMHNLPVLGSHPDCSVPYELVPCTRPCGGSAGVSRGMDSSALGPFGARVLHA